MLLLKIIYLYTKNSTRKQCKINKLKTIAPTWNHEFELPDGFYYASDIHDYMEYIIKKHDSV